MIERRKPDLKRILKYLKPHIAQMILGVSIKFTGSIMDLLLPWILAYMIDNVVPKKSIPLILFWGVMMLVCAVIALWGNIIANRLASRVAQKTTRQIRHDLFSRISYLSCRQTDRFTIPSLISRLSTDTYNIHQMLGMIQRLGVRAPILLIGGVVITLTLEPMLTLVLLCVMPFMAIVVFTVSKRGIPLYKRLQESVDHMVRTVRENVSGIRVIKALSKTGYEKHRFDSVNQDVVQNEKKAGMNMALSNPAMNLFLNVGLTLVILVGAFRVNSGVSQPGKIIAFMTYFTIILNALLSVNRIFMLISKGSASAGRISEVLDSGEDFAAFPPDHEDTPWHISFDQVSFSYLNAANNISDISFRLKRGETLGIIGPTGCGKTTIIQLLLRFYDADEGRIRISGDDIRSIPADVLHTKFGVAFQNDFLLSDTIRENIDFGRELADEDIEESSEFAQAAEFIHSIPESFDHHLTAKGTNLSGGQKQRLLISRALAANPEILILDDSSSALDYKTDAQLRRSIQTHFPDTTTIIVAQRVSSIQHADHILVLDGGRAVGYGTHNELLQSCQDYQLIAESQMGEGLVS